MAMSVQAVLLDFGGVFTFEWRTEKLLASYDRALGLPQGTVLNRLYTGEAWELVSTGNISEDEYLRRVQATWEGPWPAELEAFKQGRTPGEGINRRVVRLALALRQRYTLALLSNATLSLRSLLSELNLLDLFDVVVISAEVGLRKPDPAIYSTAAILAGADVADCLLIDDRDRNVDAAQALGMQTILFSSAAQTQRELLAAGILEQPAF